MLIATVLASAAALAALQTPPQAAVVSAARAGNGCPATQDVAAALAADRTQLTIELPDIAVQSGPSEHRGGRSHCDAIVTLAYTPGWQVTAATAELDVSGALATPSAGDLAVSAYQQGQPGTAQAHAALGGDLAKPRPVTLALDPAWSACGSTATLVAGVALKLRAGAASRLAVTRAITLKLAWRPCT